MIKKIVYDKSIKLDKNVACIGYFDGVHKGHQALIKKTVDLAKNKGIKPFLITFKPDPYEVITKNKTSHITSFNERIKLFEKYGIDTVIIINFDTNIMNKTYNQFNNEVLNNLNIDTLVCGFDFTYGKKASGNINTLKKCKFNLVIVDEITYYGKKISSTRIKEEIAKGNIKLVNKLLGYEYK